MQVTSSRLLHEITRSGNFHVQSCLEKKRNGLPWEECGNPIASSRVGVRTPGAASVGMVLPGAEDGRQLGPLLLDHHLGARVVHQNGCDAAQPEGSGPVAASAAFEVRLAHDHAEALHCRARAVVQWSRVLIEWGQAGRWWGRRRG
jgi:hypothetical protein